ncbi:MAG: Protein LemA [Fimbriimonadales bacterium]|nr:MAG: LemA family protein [Armatimonadota bacterium]MBV6502894.1 Protein LemA [Fimbriimonadales bacterium]MCE7899250.1 LemA family protein [Armatimonadetes bacterium ATM1]MDL1927823.1 LemA family protein [Fimbriimonadia bacterium ATM]MBC6969412.1 LemA family protein [Armatimonadota bacterium]
MVGLFVFIGAVLLLLLIVAGMYNGLVRARQEVNNAWSQIDVQLRRRYDLIPNLVETVKGYMKHEQETLEKVILARQHAIDATGVRQQAEAENVLTRALSGLFAVAEAYPDLKANQNMLALQEELASTENKIAFARQFYNDSVLNLNTKIEQFPTNILASMFNFKKRDMFEIDEPAAREPVKVQFT